MSDALHRIALRYEPRIRKSMLKAFGEIKDLNTLKQIEDALTTGGVEQAMNLIQSQTSPIINANLVDDLDDAITEGGRASLAVVPEGGVVDPTFRFTTVNPRTAAFVQRYQFNLVNQISSDTLQAVRNAVGADVIAGRNPVSTARVFRETIGLTPHQEKAVRNYRRALEEGDISALQRKLRDRRFDATVRRTFADDGRLSQDQVDKMTSRYREKFIKYRSEVIARTESMRAVSIGNDEAMTQMVEEGAVDPRVRKFWSPSRDDRVRNAHVRIPTMNPDGVELTASFTSDLGPIKYPRDPAASAENTIQCRCAVVYRMAS